jgi:hypothetical protein
MKLSNLINKLQIFAILLSIIVLTSPLVAQDEDEIKKKGEIIAQLDFDPEIDGFSFPNYGRSDDTEGEITAADLILLFGAKNVCIEGSTAADCVLYETAERWVEERYEKISGGRCDGFATAALRFYTERPFKNRKTFAQWQVNAEKPFDLTRNKTTQNYVTFFQASSVLSEVNKFRSTIWKKKPSVILPLIIDAMKKGTDPLSLEVWVIKDDGKYIGHAVVPIAVEKFNDAEYRIHIYDSNFPTQTRYVEVNVEEETYSYRGSQNPESDLAHYYDEGDGTRGWIAVKRVSDRDFENKFKCPFCEEDDDESARFNPGAVNFINASFAPPASKKLSVSLTGEGSLLITDPNGKRLGFDPATKKNYNEISGASENQQMGGMGEEVAPVYEFPVSTAAKKPYTFTVSGKSLDSEETIDLEFIGAGFIVGFDGIRLDKGETLMMTISPDGQELSFTASADGETPEIYLTTEDGDDQPSYEFEIGGTRLAAGKTFTVKLDLPKNKILFSDNDSDDDTFAVRVERTNPNGTTDIFEDTDFAPSKADRFQLDFSKWNGKTGMCEKDDEDGDYNFDDEQCEAEDGAAEEN